MCSAWYPAMAEFCGSLDGRGVWDRRDTCISMAESCHCSPETTTTLFVISYISIQNKIYLKKKVLYTFFHISPVPL